VRAAGQTKNPFGRPIFDGGNESPAPRTEELRSVKYTTYAVNTFVNIQRQYDELTPARNNCSRGAYYRTYENRRPNNYPRSLLDATADTYLERTELSDQFIRDAAPAKSTPRREIYRPARRIFGRSFRGTVERFRKTVREKT